LIIGIGINLKSVEFPKELQSIAGTLGADDLSRAELIAAIYRELSQFLKDPSNRSWLDDYRACSMVLGHRVCWMSNEDRFEGIAESIDEDGALAVRTDLGELIHLRTGEITLRLS
jgi:BirA family biotin operon repressor/biotin-[acetyl-CoA-carboxylase] ligase